MDNLSEGEKRACDNAYKTFMNNLNDQWDAGCVFIKNRMEGFNDRIDELESEIKHLSKGLKNYKKTFNECAKYADDRIEQMNDTNRSLHSLIAKYPTEDLQRIEKICELINQDRY